MEINNQEDTENKIIDENSSFNKLLKLQSTLQEEVALRDIFFEDRDSLLKKIENNCIEYYKTRISIQEIYDNKSSSEASKKKIKYIFCDKPNSEIPQYYDHLSNLIFYFHDDNDMALKLIENCPKESYSQLANFICNYFYVNIFSSTFLNENLLTLIYLFLEKEIDNLKIKDEKENLEKPFLDINSSFTANLLRCLSRKDEIKTFLENILKKILTKASGLLNNQGDNMFLGFDIKKMLAFLNGQNYQIKPTNKDYKSYLNLLTMEIKKCKLNLSKKKNKDNDEYAFPYSYSYSYSVSKTGLEEKNNYENNFYALATKEAFDNLLLGNDENFESEDYDDDSSEGDDDPPIKKKDFLNTNLSHNIKKDDIEYYLVNSGFYSRTDGAFFEDKKRDSSKFDIYNNLYGKELNKEVLLDLIEKEDDRDMEEYFLKQLNVIQDNENGNVYTNTKLINEIIHLGVNADELEEVILIYKYHFEIIKLFIDELFTSLFQIKENAPYMIRAICTIISKLFSIKFKEASNILKIKIISEFVFNNLIIPILENPQFNGTLMFDFSKDKSRNTKIKTVIKVIQKLINCELYNSTLNDEYLYTIFNPYFIEIMPYIFEFYREMSNTKLPINIENLLQQKSENLPVRTIKYNYLSLHPEERLEHQSMCMTFKDIFTLYNIIKSNENEILGDKTSIIYKTYKKITYNEDHLKSKVENDENNSKKTFIFFSKLVLDDDLKEKVNSKKDQKLSFQTDDNLADIDYAKFILTRVKFSINTIMKHLNILSKSNSLNNQTESTEDFIKDLDKMIRLEGFSEMLKEKKLPLEWFGLYLQSNIENIPQNYKENNYALLYNELIEESKQNLLKIKNDDSLNTIYSKIINSEKMIDIGINNLKRIVNNKIKFEVIDFIKNSNIPVILDIGSQNNQIGSISVREDMNQKDKKEANDKKIISKKCQNIIEFCKNFPDIDSDDIFALEEELELKNILNTYFQIVHKYMEKESTFIEYSVDERKNIKKQIENFIYVQLYDKIYCKTPIKADSNILYTMVRLSWIKPYMLDESLRHLDEKMVQLMMSFISNINEEKSPTNKLRQFENIYFIISNIITLCGYDKNMFINILVYTFIKGQPEYLYSTLRYIEIFLSDEMKEEKSFLISKIKEVISKIIGFSEKDVKLSKSQYDENCNKATK